MASTYLSDINYDTQVFSDNLDAVFTERIALMESGALVEVPDSIVSKDTKGNSVVIPRWAALHDQLSLVHTRANALALLARGVRRDLVIRPQSDGGGTFSSSQEDRTARPLECPRKHRPMDPDHGRGLATL